MTKTQQHQIRKREIRTWMRSSAWGRVATRGSLGALVASWVLAGFAAVGIVTPVPASQSIHVRGRVVDAEGAPISGAAVDAPDQGRGTLTDAHGRFELELPVGTHTLRIWRLDHDTIERTVDVEAATPVLEFQLQPRELRVERIVVQARRPQGPQLDEPGRYVLGSETVDAQIGGFEDVVRSVQALPGVGRASDYHGEFFVRGAGAHANAVYLDGIPIFFPYHILGFNSIFNPGLVESADFLSGGAPAAYGGATGGVLLVRSRGASPAPYRGNVGVSYIAGHLHAAGGGAARGWALSLRRSYHDKLVRLLDRSNTSQIPSFYDAMLRARWKPNSRHQFVGGLLVAGDGLSIPTPEASALRHDIIRLDAPGEPHQDSDFVTSDDQLDLQNRLVVGSLQWKALLGDEAFVETTAGWVPQRLRFSLVGDNRESIDIDTRTYTLRSDLTWRQKKHRLRVGLESYRSETRGFVSAYAAILNLRQTNSALNLVDQKERYTVNLDRVRTYAAVYLHDDWTWSDRVEFGVGMRYAHDTLARQNLLSPRLSIHIRPHPLWQLRTTLGVYHTLRNTPMEVQPTREGAALGAERATEATLGLTGVAGEPLRVGLTGWVKDFTQLVYESEPAYYDNGAIGRSRGLEGWLEFAPRRSALRAKLHYAWTFAQQRDPLAWRRQWSEDPVTRERVWGPVYEAPYWYSPLHDQRHRGGLETRLRAGAWEFGAHLQVASGLPYTPVESAAAGEDGTVYGIVGRKGSARLPAYRRLDVRAERRFHGSRLQWRVYAEILNVTGANNVYMTRWNRAYTQQYSVTMLPFLPTLGIEASF